MKKILIAFLALGATVLTGFSQTSYPVASYSPLTIPLPIVTLATSSSTNLSNGWIGQTTFTNTTVNYSQSSGTFVTNTIITTNSTTTFAQFYCGQQKDCGLQWNMQGCTNVVLTFAKSDLSGQPDTANNFTWTINTTSKNANGYVIGTTNIPGAYIGGFGYLYLVSIQNADANNALTNFSLTIPVKRNAP